MLQSTSWYIVASYSNDKGSWSKARVQRAVAVGQELLLKESCNSKDLMMEVLLPAAAGALLGTSGRRGIILWVVASSR
jgi:hypothetical protein